MGKTTCKKHVIKKEGKAATHLGFENEIHLSEFIDFKLKDHVGAYVLQERSSKTLTFKFGFDCPGIHSELDEEKFLDRFYKLEQGLKSLPFGESLTLHVSSFSESQSRIAQLERLYNISGDPGIQVLLEGESRKVQELKKRGLRQPKTIRLYGTFDPNRIFVRRGKDPFEQLFSQWVDKGNELLGNLDQRVLFKRQKQLFARIYQDGYKAWSRLLRDRLGLEVRPLTAQELWSELWSYLNKSPVPEIPQVIEVTPLKQDPYGIGVDLKLIKNRDVHAATYLTYDGIPFDDRKWVHFKGHYVGAMRFVEKPAGWNSEREQLHYLWDLISREESGDMEIVTQFCTTDANTTKKALDDHSKQATAQEDHSNISDRSAKARREASEEAQDKLLAGNIPISVGTVVLVHRDSVQKLDDDCATISSQFQEPCWLAREEKFAWKAWAQTLPCRVDKLLNKCASNKRLIYPLDESLGMFPVVSTNTPDRSGVEFISADGSSVFVEMCDVNRPQNMALFGYTRAGKSVLVASFLLQALATGTPITAIDYPKGDGTSTFTSMTKIVGGAYFNIAEQQNNLFEMPDLRGIPTKKLKTHLATWRASLKGIVLSLIGESGDRKLDGQVKAVVARLLRDFLADPQIQARYKAAIEGGIDSEAWQQTPTLETFRDFVSQFNPEGNTLKEQALEWIDLRLDFWLASDIAHAIAKPSSIKTDSQLIVFALTNVEEDEEAAILGLAAYAAALRRSLSHPSSIFFIDESPILFQFPWIAALIAKLCANFGKAGGRVIITAQTVDAIADSGHGSQILGNCKVKLVGAIEPEQAASYVDHLKFDARQAEICGSEDFIRKPGQDWTNWMLSYSGRKFRVKFFAGEELLYSVANNPGEQGTREHFLERLPIGEALRATGRHLRVCESKGLNPLEHLPDLPIKQEKIVA